MEKNVQLGCFCVQNPDAPEDNFGWTRAEFCKVASALRLSKGDTAHTLSYNMETELWRRVTLTKLSAVENALQTLIKTKGIDFDVKNVSIFTSEALRLLPRYLKNWSKDRSTWVLCYGHLYSRFKQLSKWKLYDALKRKGHSAAITEDMQIPDEDDALYQVYRGMEYKEDFLTALENGMQKLQQNHLNYYEVVSRYFYKKLGHTEIAEELNITEKTSQQHNTRGKNKLREYICEELRSIYPDFDPLSFNIKKIKKNER
jgi:hypothetical protein